MNSFYCNIDSIHNPGLGNDDDDDDSDVDDDFQGPGGEHEAALGDWKAEAGRGEVHQAPVRGGAHEEPAAQGDESDKVKLISSLSV